MNETESEEMQQDTGQRPVPRLFLVGSLIALAAFIWLVSLLWPTLEDRAAELSTLQIGLLASFPHQLGIYPDPVAGDHEHGLPLPLSSVDPVDGDRHCSGNGPDVLCIDPCP